MPLTATLARIGQSLRRLPFLGLMALFAILTATPASASEADLVAAGPREPERHLPRHHRAHPAAGRPRRLRRSACSSGW